MKERIINADMKVIPYNPEENWIMDKDTIIITDLEGKLVEVKGVIFYDPVQGFIQTPDALYVPNRTIGETH